MRRGGIVLKDFAVAQLTQNAAPIIAPVSEPTLVFTERNRRRDSLGLLNRQIDR